LRVGSAGVKQRGANDDCGRRDREPEVALAWDFARPLHLNALPSSTNGRDKGVEANPFPPLEQISRQPLKKLIYLRL
jgi:hypothetical protein